METFNDLNAALSNVLSDMGMGDTLPGTDQLLTNALGITLAHRWGRLTPRTMPKQFHTYAPEHRNGRSSHFERVPAQDLRQMIGNPAQSRWHRYSFLVDFFVEQWNGTRTAGTEVPIVGAEIEAYPRHGVTDDIDRNDYQWDFYKLLHVKVPRRFFLACACKEGLDGLQASLFQAWRRTRELATAKDRLAIILLPAGENERKQVRLGIATGRGELQFRLASNVGA